MERRLVPVAGKHSIAVQTFLQAFDVEAFTGRAPKRDVEKQVRLVYNDDAMSEREIISEIGRKYLWWQPADGRPHPQDRMIAQIMNFGTLDDMLLLERTIGPERLVGIMTRAEPGWLSDRSWELWRGRLSAATGAVIPDEPPRRSFDARTL
jgi:hypothetical protein